jgi:hypothetical protein
MSSAFERVQNTFSKTTPPANPELNSRFRFKHLLNLEPERCVQFVPVQVRTDFPNRTTPPLLVPLDTRRAPHPGRYLVWSILRTRVALVMADFSSIEVVQVNLNLACNTRSADWIYCDLPLFYSAGLQSMVMGPEECPAVLFRVHTALLAQQNLPDYSPLWQSTHQVAFDGSSHCAYMPGTLCFGPSAFKILQVHCG